MPISVLFYKEDRGVVRFLGSLPGRSIKKRWTHASLNIYFNVGWHMLTVTTVEWTECIVMEETIEPLKGKYWARIEVKARCWWTHHWVDWRLWITNAILCEKARQRSFFASPRHFKSTLMHNRGLNERQRFNASARHSDSKKWWKIQYATQERDQQEGYWHTSFKKP